VIHTVGPVWQGGGEGEPARLASCYRSSLSLARDHGLASIAFPAISTGAYGYPPRLAAQVAAAAVGEFLGRHAFEQVLFVCFSEVSTRVYAEAIRAFGRA
jgi:O-acetyl-ADP-ribose deacetylase (regulator of RNase III)